MGNYGRIAKNTLYLYMRMIVTLLVGLYTSRVMLQALGEVDYGINNVVGGFVAMFSLVSGALTGAISRFITFELGTGNIKSVKAVFSASLLVLTGLSIIVLILSETVGLWFLHHKLVIPEERMYAAGWVYQLGVVVFVVNLLRIPYNASIVAHEHLNVFALLSIIETFFKLIICVAILHTSYDKLIVYAILLAGVNLSISGVYFVYSRRKFAECRCGITWNRMLLKDIFGYAGWSFIGSSGFILKGQGGTVLLNLFGGPIVNTANAVAYALSSAVQNFVNCFTTSYNPQITKLYAAQKYDELQQLVIYSAKFSFFMLFIIALPVMLNAGFVLNLWLGEVPDHSRVFVVLIICMSLIDIISVPLITMKNATGRIRNYQIVVGSIQLLALPLGYVSLKIGGPVESLYAAYIVVAILCLIARMYMLNSDIPKWSSRQFILRVCMRVAFVVFIAPVIPLFIYIQIAEGWLNFIATSVVSVLSAAFTIYYIGLSKFERSILSGKCKEIISKTIKKWKTKRISDF